VRRMLTQVSTADCVSYARTLPDDLGPSLAEDVGEDAWVHTTTRRLAEQGQHAAAPAPRPPAEFRVYEPETATSGVALGEEWRSFYPPEGVAWVDELCRHWPLKETEFAEVFAGYPDLPFCLRVIREGVAVVGDARDVAPFQCPPYASVSQHVREARAAVQREVDLLQVVPPPAGLVSSTQHATAAVPKPTGGVRIVHDASRPLGSSLNDHISHLYQPMATIEEVAETMTPKAFAAKLDISCYFVHFGVNPLHWPLLAFQFPLNEGGSLQELWCTRLMFGLRHGPEVATRFTRALVWLLRKCGWHATHGMLDDFYVQSSDEVHCWLGWLFMMRVLTHVGFAVNFGATKTLPPAHVQLLWGVEVDLSTMELRLDSQRVARLREQLRSVRKTRGRQRPRPTRRELDSLLGRLVWCSAVVRGGKLHTNHLRLATLHGAAPHHHVALPPAAQCELEWWDAALGQCNGRAAVTREPADVLVLQTDARGVWDSPFPCVGCFLEGRYVSLSSARLRPMFTDTPADDAPIQLWELFAVVVAFRLWGAVMAGRHVRALIDNSNVVQWLVKGTVGVRALTFHQAWLLELHDEGSTMNGPR